MASIILSTVGSAVGGALGGPIGAIAGKALGQVAGGFVDSKLGLEKKLAPVHGPRLADLAVQTSTYGKMIPVVYGAVRIAGNIIWSRPITETVTTTNASGGGGKGGGGGKVSQSQTTYSYSVSLAIAICEGEIDDVLRVWADSKPIDPKLGTYRLYKGSETQTPDGFIESFEGVGKTPAYRGLAYVVIEDFPLADYGNRIPNFTFEVKRKALAASPSENVLENMIKGMIMIPGSGEFVYDTVVQSKTPGELVSGNWVQKGEKIRINQNNRDSKADSLVALDQLKAACPNVEWIGVVVTWFGNNTSAASCVIKPGVEYQSGAITEPEIWSAGSFTRSTAHPITIDVNGKPVYGGTPDDQSVLRYLDELRAKGYKIMFYPMFFMDTTGKPWRGRVTGSATDVANFFTKTDGYNAFISHYANLVVGKVDAFVIGSELIGLTKVKDGSNNFPAVSALVSLAATVRGILGSGVKLTYAADWSEYHHTDGGWYNLDPLWASSNIDFVGIDCYVPLTDEPQSGYDLQKVIDGWTSGEGYDWYYSDPGRTVQAPLSAAYAWKNFSWWWNNYHVNPDSSTTAWVPQSKKIWFTEYGYPSVDGATNQPNVFYDPASTENAFPYYSKGRVDFRAQRLGLLAAETKWAGSSMIERMFVWTWDARPFPFYPDLASVWSDGDNWKYGHWVNGKLGLSSLAAIVADLCRRAGLTDADFDVLRLFDVVDGFVLTDITPARAAIELLQAGFFFDSTESGDALKFVPRGGSVAKTIVESELIPQENGEVTEPLRITRAQELDLPQKVDVIYINRLADYQPGNQHSQRVVTSARDKAVLNLPVVFADQQAKNVADITLFNSWLSRTRFAFSMPVKYAALEPTDIIEITASAATHKIRLTSLRFGAPGMLQAEGVAEDISAYDFYNAPGEVANPPSGNVVIPPGNTRLEILDLPALPTDAGEQGALRFAASGLESGWKGAALFRSDDNGANYSQVSSLPAAAVLGNATGALASGPSQVMDIASSVTVLLLFGELESVTKTALLNGANLAVLGDEILQFQTATLVEPGKYTLSGFLRGRMGTEDKIASHAAGEKFVLLDSRVAKETTPNALIGLERLYKPVSVGNTLGQTASTPFTYRAASLKPFSPVHIKGSRDGSGNLTISFTRRTRVGGELRDYVDAPLSEVAEKYEIDIMNGGSVARTISTTTTQATYSAANQTADFGSLPPSVTVRIYQISSVVGRGAKGEGVV